MRRFIAIFASGRSDNSDPPSSAPDPHITAQPKSRLLRPKNSRLLPFISPITVSVDPPMPALDQGHSSSSSSTGSTSLRTPEGDDCASRLGLPSRTPSRKSWMSWMGSKHKSTVPSSPSLPPDWSQPVSAVPQPAPKPLATRQQHVHSVYDSENSSNSDLEAQPVPNPIDHELSPMAFAEALTGIRLSPAFESPPLYHPPGSPLFPRSCNPPRSLCFRETVESTMHRKCLLQRLQHRSLSASERHSLAAFGSRVSFAASHKHRLPLLDEGVRPDLTYVTQFSRGLQRWASRPYFEEHMALWAPNEDNVVVCSNVRSSGFGVWALEVSEGLDALAGEPSENVVDPLSPSEPVWEPPSPASSSSSQPSSETSWFMRRYNQWLMIYSICTAH